MASIQVKKYHYDRLKRIDYIYRLNKRLKKVVEVIKNNFKKYSNLSVLDIGTADGLLLSKLNLKFEFKDAIGIDMSMDLIKTNKDKNINLKLGNAEKLNFRNNIFDIIIATAVIEHVDNPNKMLRECYRVLKKNGILIITTPNPFFDMIATKIGYFNESDHVEVMNIKKVKYYLKNNKFNIIKSEYFMFFPFFKIPMETIIENTLNRLRIGKIMTNQLIVGKK